MKWNAPLVLAVGALALLGFLALPGCGHDGHVRHARHGAAVAPAPEPEVQTCPFMPQRLASQEHYVEHDGQRIHVCCGGCVRRFNEDPEKYLAKLGNAPERKANPHEGHAGCPMQKGQKEAGQSCGQQRGNNPEGRDCPKQGKADCPKQGKADCPKQGQVQAKAEGQGCHAVQEAEARRQVHEAHEGQSCH